MTADVSIDSGNSANGQPLLNRAAEQAKAFAQRSGTVIREQAQKASDSTVAYIQEQPVKSVLIAAATGAAVTLAIGLLSRSRRD